MKYDSNILRNLTYILRYFKYSLEAVFALFILSIFRIMPLDFASAFGGLIARTIAPLTKPHRIARNNIEKAMPELSQAQVAKILSDMWDNLGRTIGEYPHLSRKIMQKRITVEGREILEDIKTTGKSAIFVAGHFANWEITPLTSAACGVPLILIYRAANNPLVDFIIKKLRSHYKIELHAKGKQGAKETIKALHSGKSVGLLIDQRTNDGEKLKFFNLPAMTTTGATSLAIKTATPIIAVRIVRTHGVHFHVTINPPIFYPKEKSKSQAMQEINDLLESWIREYPAQWFWVHRRWGKI